MTTAEILREARKLIEKEGWAQGGDVSVGRGAQCIATALWAVHQDADAYVLAKNAFREANGFGGMLITWNDAPGRTQTEVLAAFDRAIAIAEQPPAGPLEKP